MTERLLVGWIVEELMGDLRNLVSAMPVATPYLTYLEALSTNTQPPELDWDITNANYQEGRDVQLDQSVCIRGMRSALSAFDANPGQDTANALYARLVEHKLHFGLFEESRIPVLGDDLKLGMQTMHLLTDIAIVTPQRLVFINVMYWLLALHRDLDQALMRAAGFDHELTDAIWFVCKELRSKPSLPIDPLTLSLAKAGSYEAQFWLCEQLDRNPSDEVKGLALRYGFSDGTPECSELYGEPNSAFAPALVEFVQRTELLTALEVNEIDGDLRHAALDILSEGVCTCIVSGSELSYFKQHIPIEAILGQLIRHLQGQSLSLDDLYNLAWLYRCVFEEIDRRLTDNTNALFDESELVVSREEHQQLAQLVRDVFLVPANRDRLAAAIEAGGVVGQNAQMTLKRMERSYASDLFMQPI